MNSVKHQHCHYQLNLAISNANHQSYLYKNLIEKEKGTAKYIENELKTAVTKETVNKVINNADTSTKLKLHDMCLKKKRLVKERLIKQEALCDRLPDRTADMCAKHAGELRELLENTSHPELALKKKIYQNLKSLKEIQSEIKVEIRRLEKNLGKDLPQNKQIGCSAAKIGGGVVGALITPITGVASTINAAYYYGHFDSEKAGKILKKGWCMSKEMAKFARDKKLRSDIEQLKTEIPEQSAATNTQTVVKTRERLYLGRNADGKSKDPRKNLGNEPVLRVSHRRAHDQ